MPTYEYECSDTECAHSFETYQSFSEEPLNVCPACGQETKRVISGGMGVIDKSPKTLGTLAEQNNKRLGREKCIQQEKEIKERGRAGRKYVGKLPAGVEQPERPVEQYQPWWRPKGTVDRSLAKMTPQEKSRYIKHGKRPS